ncbi:S41 family peptidase [Bacteroides ihuae]|uniref:S41 family peptidase n=1 Tax=Bacteroides ihuae TaxID=1852362 RepID=UPI0008D8DE56|nr:S41 family peptidase [Bacteroides ihuae]
MNAKNSIYSILLILTVCTSFASCSGEDRRKEYVEQTELDHWIDSTMRQEYYWYEDIPATSKLNYFNAPATFLKSVSTSKDSYSFVEDLTATNYNYGLKYKLYELTKKAYVAQVLYVIADSPASEAGLSRGDYITTINGDSITTTTSTALDEGSTLKVSVAKYANGKLGTSEIKQLSVARATKDDPIYYHSVFTWDGKAVGYLVYNHFTAGIGDSDETYNNELLSLSKEFSGVSNFILDLRYNNSGTMPSARLLGTILAPESALGKTFCTMKYNNKKSPQEVSNTFDASLISTGTNLNLQTIYVLVSATTSGNAELLISALKPYMNVVVIGAATKGNNLGLDTYTNSKYMWAIHIAVCKLSNAKGDTYESGFIPNYVVIESRETFESFLPFGNTKELLLGTALSIIDGTYTPPTTTSN